MERCGKCQKPLSMDEIGLHKKIVNREAEQFLCIDCLAEHFKTDREELFEMIERFRKAGCTLFSPASCVTPVPGSGLSRTAQGGTQTASNGLQEGKESKAWD